MGQLLEEIELMGVELKQLASDNDWEKLATLAIQRQKKIECYFSLKPLPDKEAIIVSVIDKIKKNDQEINTLIQKIKKNNISQSLALKAAHFAINQYRNNS